MTLTSRFRDFISNKNLFQKGDVLLIAVSGGKDSVTLCELCHQSGFSFEIVHCNFQLRGEDSTRDEQFTEQLAIHYEAPFHLRRFDTAVYAAQHKLSIQEAARNLRYEWFRMLLNDKKHPGKNAVLLTAHHANDAIETLLMNFFKGTGIHGLQGIPVRNGNIVRPLLFVSVKEIEDFVAENQLRYVEDASNSSDKYTRNFFRNRLIPSIQEVFPKTEENLLHNMARFQDTATLFDKAVFDIRKKLVEEKEGELYMPVLKILKTPAYKTVLYEILKDYGFLPGQMTDISGLLTAESGKFVDSSSHRCLRNRKWLIITLKHTIVARHILVDNDENVVAFPEGTLRIDEQDWQADGKLINDANVAMLDASGIAFPLLLRPWKQGDYFYPLGMAHKKKLSRYFIDQKLSIAEKEKVWVLESGKKIIWIIGHRIDDRYKITGKTKKLLRIRLEAR